MSPTPSPAAACPASSGWWVVILGGLVAAWGLGLSALRIATEGPGVLGVNNDVPWGWDIVLFVYWIGLGHAGTLISAVLLLTRQRWREPIAHYAEWMTLCAVGTAAVFPLVHVGRAWMIWQVTPLPVASGVWPHPGSALMWDAAAISAYALLSLLFLHMGMQGARARSAGLRPLWERSCVLMAGVLTPTVVLVHSVVACDFATTLRWHWPLMPPFFVCGALLSGMAAIILIALWRRCEARVHDCLARLTLALALIIGIFYALELQDSPAMWSGEYALMLGLNVGLPCLFLIPAARTCKPLLALVAVGILAGMWVERSLIIISRSIVETGGAYAPTGVDTAMLVGSVGLFFALFAAGALYLRRHSAAPAPRLNPDTAPPAAPGRAALAGAAGGLLLALAWLLLTGGADTAGAAGHRPEGLFIAFPIITVAGLLGAGLALFFHLRHRLHP
ncbi:MAG: polysulfide reductase NrfD [Akkermansiaceae bacterium]|nr:polysulfide reductase NrfD [Akkermansiaceae bacterium]